MIGPDATSSQFRFERTDVAAARDPLLDERRWSRRDRPIHPCRLQRGRDRRHLRVRVGSGGRRRLLRPVPFNGGIVPAEVTTTGPAVLNPALEIAAILAKQ